MEAYYFKMLYTPDTFTYDLLTKMKMNLRYIAFLAETIFDCGFPGIVAYFLNGTRLIIFKLLFFYWKDNSTQGLTFMYQLQLPL